MRFLFTLKNFWLNRFQNIFMILQIIVILLLLNSMISNVMYNGRLNNYIRNKEQNFYLLSGAVSSLSLIHISRAAHRFYCLQSTRPPRPELCCSQTAWSGLYLRSWLNPVLPSAANHLQNLLLADVQLLRFVDKLDNIRLVKLPAPFLPDLSGGAWADKHPDPPLLVQNPCLLYTSRCV